MNLTPHLHPTLRRQLGSVAETALLAGTVTAIWISVIAAAMSALHRFLLD